MDSNKLKERLIEKGLKVTSRRLSILEAILELNHPTAEEILKYIRKNYPDTATATVYKALNVLVEKKVINKVNTEQDIARYDAILESHHHLYCSELNRIENYNDEELNRILRKYLKNKKIPGFNIEGFNLQIIGKFTDQKHNTLKIRKNEKQKTGNSINFR
ncbi:MAG: transcriptional repressor [Bacteroidota bacterium]|nr:transcriptional repressor [Bacteroidota bacterium]